MTSNEFIVSIYESMCDGSLLPDIGTEIIMLMEEKATPLADKLQKLKLIKEMAPKPNDGSQYIKKFLNKYYDDIVSCALLTDRNVKALSKHDSHVLIATILGIFSGMIPLFIGGTGPVICAGVIVVLSCLLPTVHWVVKAVHAQKIIVKFDNLTMIRNALDKLTGIPLPVSYTDMIYDIIHLIDITKMELYQYGYSDVKNEFVEMKLRVHEAFIDGAITESQRDILLNMIK